MEDVVLVTGESVRFDHADALEFVSSLGIHQGIACSHYTRPSLASLHSSSYTAAINTEIEHPALAEILQDAGYTCIGLTTSPQADETFDFPSGFDTYSNFVEPGIRGTKLQEVLAGFDFVGRVYNRLFPRHDRRSHLPRDDEVIQQAIEEYNGAPSPRFLWLHLMESHRPYGRGEDAIAKSLDRKAKYSPGKITEEEHADIISKYRASLNRIDAWIEDLLTQLDSDPLFIFTGDHGEGFGEHGYYFHPPQRRRVDDYLIQVPVVFDGIEPKSEGLSLIDIAPTILGAVDIDIPAVWHGNNLLNSPTESTLTIAPWKEKATVAWQDFNRKLVAENANLSFEQEDIIATVEQTEVSRGMKQHLRDLGYIDAG